jgi:hypothetical protein
VTLRQAQGERFFFQIFTKTPFALSLSKGHLCPKIYLSKRPYFHKLHFDSALVVKA